MSMSTISNSTTTIKGDYVLDNSAVVNSLDEVRKTIEKQKPVILRQEKPVVYVKVGQPTIKIRNEFPQDAINIKVELKQHSNLWIYTILITNSILIMSNLIIECIDKFSR